MIKEFAKDLLYVCLIYATLFLMLQVGLILENIVARIGIQKLRADKIELFLEHKYKGEYSAKAPH